MTTGEKIAALRKEQGMSQEALGEKLSLSRQAVSKWEADQAVPTMDNLMELSKLFGVPVDTLLRPDAELMPKAEDSDESWPGAENQPVRNGNRKWKITAIAAAGLLCVSVVCSAVSLWRVIAMQQQIDTLRMQSGPSTIYYPDNTSAENSDLADWSENVTVDRENSENLLVTVSAVPRSMLDGETAKFVVRSGDQSWECDAEDNNGYSGKLSVPFVDTFSVYLTLTGTSGETRNILVTSEYDLEQRLRLSVTAHWNNGGISSNGEKNPTTTVSGGVEVRVYCSSEDIKPASSNIVLYRNGKVQDMQPIDIKDFTGDSTFYTDVNWRNLEGELGEYRVKVVMLDNFDKLYTVDVDYQKRPLTRSFLLFPRCKCRSEDINTACAHLSQSFDGGRRRCAGGDNIIDQHDGFSGQIHAALRQNGIFCVALPRGVILLRGLLADKPSLAQCCLARQGKRLGYQLCKQLRLIISAFTVVQKSNRHVGNQIRLPVVQPCGESHGHLRREPVRTVGGAAEFEPFHGIAYCAAVIQRSDRTVRSGDGDDLIAAVFPPDCGSTVRTKLQCAAGRHRKIRAA